MFIFLSAIDSAGLFLENYQLFFSATKMECRVSGRPVLHDVSSYITYNEMANTRSTYCFFFSVINNETCA